MYFKFETPKAVTEFKEVFRGRSRAKVVSFCVLLGLIIMVITSSVK